MGFRGGADVAPASGLRLSTARRVLLHALFDSDRPLSAEELAGDGDVASAYRNLEVLEGLGLVRHVHLGHGPGLYQPPAVRASSSCARAAERRRRCSRRPWTACAKPCSMPSASRGCRGQSKR